MLLLSHSTDEETGSESLTDLRSYNMKVQSQDLNPLSLATEVILFMQV